MQFSLTLLALAAAVATHARQIAPFPIKADSTTSAPSSLSTGTAPLTANELSGPCRPVTFIWARGSTEKGNLGKDVGAPLSAALKAHYGDSYVATQGVDYGASLLGNLDKSGCEAPGVSNFVKDIELAASKCPQTKIIIGGYSQGAACTHDAVKLLPSATVNRIVAAVTFGDTRNKQGHGEILPIPPSRTKIFCAKGDLVCDGTIIVDPAHLSYTTDVGPAAQWLEQMLSGSNGSD